jgi:hypothetical protein
MELINAVYKIWLSVYKCIVELFDIARHTVQIAISFGLVEEGKSIISHLNWMLLFCLSIHPLSMIVCSLYNSGFCLL